MKDHRLTTTRPNGLPTMDANESPTRTLHTGGRTMAHRPWQFDVSLSSHNTRPATTTSTRPATRARRTGQRHQLRQAVLARHNLAA